MLRWFINIFIAVITAVLVIGMLRIILVGGPSGMPAIPLEIPFFIMLSAGALGVLAWATGLTRLGGYRNRQHATMVLAYLEQAVRLNLPLSRMLQAAQEAETGSLASKLGQLRNLLANGLGITDALRVAIPGTPIRSLGLLQAAERVGRTGTELDRLVREQQRKTAQNLSEQSLIRSYPPLMIVAIAAVVTILMVYVMPRYRQVLTDFKVPLPRITVLVINIAHIVTTNGWVQLAIVLAITLAIVQQVRLSIGHWKPAIWFTTSRQYGDVCHVIADALEAGEPLDWALDAASQLAISPLLKQKIRWWFGALQQGIPTAKAASSAGMPSLIVGLTSTSQGDAVAEAFEFLSRYYAAKFSRSMTLLRAALVPAMVFFFGIIVAIIALAMFLPLVAMIVGTADSDYGGRL
jgi:type II secretory pathway component PulF